MIHKVQEAELDEMWSFGGGEKQPRWLWEALDHQPGRIVASTFGIWSRNAMWLASGGLNSWNGNISRYAHVSSGWYARWSAFPQLSRCRIL
jgi:IS1 family transposase